MMLGHHGLLAASGLSASKFMLFGGSHGTSQTITVGSSATTYGPVEGSELTGGNTDESIYRVYCPYSVKTSKLASKLHANTSTVANLIVRARKNGANGNQTVTIPAGSIAWQRDASNTDSYTVGDYMAASYVLDSTSGSGSVTLFGQTMVMETVDTTKHATLLHGRREILGTGASYYMPLGGFGLGEGAAERPVAEINWPAADIPIGKVYVDVTANTASVSVTFTLTASDVSTGCTVTVAAGVTGLQTLSGMPYTPSANEKLAIKVTRAGGTGSITATAYTWIENTRSNPKGVRAVLHVSGQTADQTSARYVKLGGGSVQTTTATESVVQIQHGYAGTYSKYAVYNAAYSNTGTTTYRFRKNAANGNQVVTAPSLGVGWYQDTTNSDAFAATDECCHSVVRELATAILFHSIVMQETYTSG